MESMAEADPEPPPPPLSDLILSLKQATLMAKQLPCTADPTHILHIYSSLNQVHYHLSNFLSTPKFPHPSGRTPSPLPTATSPCKSATATMTVMALERNFGPTIDMVEEQMRDCFIKNKRPKRRLSSFAAALAEERWLNRDGFVGSVKGFDPQGSKERSLELVYQFHG